MNLYLLKREDVNVSYDEAAGFVIRAPNADFARACAARHSGDEGTAYWLLGASCELLASNVGGHEGVVLRDFRAG